MLNQLNRLGNEVIISSAGDDIVSGQSVSTGGLNQHVTRTGTPRPLPLHLAAKGAAFSVSLGHRPGLVLPRSVSAESATHFRHRIVTSENVRSDIKTRFQRSSTYRFNSWGDAPG